MIGKGRSLFRKFAYVSMRPFAPFLWIEVDRGAAFLDSPLVTREYEDTLATVLLLALDGKRHRLLRPAEDGCAPAYVRRAEDFVVANLTEPVSLADVVEAAEVNVRTLTRAFKKARGKGVYNEATYVAGHGTLDEREKRTPFRTIG